MRGWSVLGSLPFMGTGIFSWSLLMARWIGSKLVCASYLYPYFGHTPTHGRNTIDRSIGRNYLQRWVSTTSYLRSDRPGVYLYSENILTGTTGREATPRQECMRTSLRSLHEVLNISPKKRFQRHSFAQPDQACYLVCLSSKNIHTRGITWLQYATPEVPCWRSLIGQVHY